MNFIRTIDDRGHRVSLVLAGVLSAIKDWRRSWPPIGRKSIRRGAGHVLRQPAFWAFAGACGVVAILTRLFYEDTSTGLGMMVFSPVFVSMLTLALTTSRGVLGFGGALPARMCRAMLKEHRCPACGYDISAQDAQADACVVCPECSAAWRQNQLGPNASSQPEVIVIHEWDQASL